jgi:lipid A ethanolaminephosphotransferase
MGNTQFKNLQISNLTFNFITSIVLVLIYNQPLWQLLVQLQEGVSWNATLFIASFFVFLVAVINFVLNIVSVKYLNKPIIVAVLLSSSLAAYLMNAYGLFFDNSLVQHNPLISPGQVTNIFSSSLLVNFALLGALPSVLVMCTNITYSPFLKECKMRFVIAGISLLVIVLNLSVFYKDYASTLYTIEKLALS